ncbi:MAG: hypothetical protein GX589_01840, partial [Deltaproteobacteria bacterium]|nr:hypothetical protein [Deltaproteobacteria bacterium]
GWHENLREFIDSNYELRALIPKYFKPGEAKRLRRNYVLPTSNQFELSIIKIIRTCLAKKYFWDCSKVFEFGCGTGYHLVSLAQLLPQSEIIGLDWVTASVQIVQLLAEKYKLRLRGGIFDYYQPDRSLDLDATSAVFTFASLEQIGDRHKEFIDFILERKPKICLNVECLEELYDPGDLLDFLALHYHRRRGYLSGYLGRLRELAERGRVEIIEERRTFFGSTYHEAYAFVAWRPL